MSEHICEKIDFILRGGIWELLVRILSASVESALVTEVKGRDVIVIEAVNVQLDKLIFSGAMNELEPHIPPVPAFHKLYMDSFELPPTPQFKDFGYVVRFFGDGWKIFVFLKSKPSRELLEGLRPFLNVMSHWALLRDSTLLEGRLSKLSYMILATKNTIASVFEPMGTSYFADFVKDVLSESLFTKRIAIYSDEDGEISHLKGFKLGSPVRKGVFASKFLSPTPIVCSSVALKEMGFDKEIYSKFYVVILPILSSPQAKKRIFCVAAWDEPVEKETLNFMELVGNVASKSLEINELHIKDESSQRQLESRSFTVAAFHNMLDKLISHTDRRELLAFIIGLFSEMSQSTRVKLVVYDEREKKYVLVSEAFGSIVAQCFEALTPKCERMKIAYSGEIDAHALASLGFKFADMKECHVYPFCVEDGVLEGFVAMSEINCVTEVPDYPVVFDTFAQIAARELHYRLSR